MADPKKQDLHSEFDKLPDVRDAASLHSEFDSLPSAGSNSDKIDQYGAEMQNLLMPEPSDTVKDFGRGSVQGLTAGFSDEGLGALGATKDVLTGDAAIQDWATRYRARQQEEQAANEAAAKRSPIAYNVGDYGTGLLAALMTGGGSAEARLAAAGAKEATKRLGARELAALAAKGAGVGATQALGRSTATIENDPTKLATDVVEGGTAGAVLGPVLGMAGNKLARRAEAKAAEKAAQVVTGGIEESPLRAQVSEAYRAGKAGESFSPSKSNISREVAKEEEAVKGLKGTFDTAEQKLIQEKQALLENSDAVIQSPKSSVPAASAEGFQTNAIIQPDPKQVAEINPFLDSLKQSGQIQNKDLSDIANSLELYANGGLSTKQASDLQQQVKAIAFKTKDPQIQTSLMNLVDELDGAIEKAVPGVAEANQNIHQLLKSGRETLLSRGHDPDVSKIKVSRLGNEDLKTEDELHRILGSLRADKGEATKESQGALNKTIANLKALQESNPEMFQKLGIDIPQLEGQVYQAADRTALSNKLTPGQYLGDELKTGKGLFGVPILGEQGLLRGANLAGRVVKKSSDFYKLPKEGLSQAAQQLGLSGSPALKSLGDGLQQSVESGNQGKINAAMFTILQNPEARKALGYSAEKQNESGER